MWRATLSNFLPSSTSIGRSIPRVLKHYAVNYKTGAPIPQALVDKIKKSETWGQGYALGELLAAVAAGHAMAYMPARAPKQDVDAFEIPGAKETGTDFPNVRRVTARAISAHLGQWLCFRILRLSVDGDAG